MKPPNNTLLYCRDDGEGTQWIIFTKFAFLSVLVKICEKILMHFPTSNLAAIVYAWLLTMKNQKFNIIIAKFNCS